MKRCLTILSVLSLFLLLLSLALRLRSRSVMDDLFLIYSIDGSERLSCMQGQLLLQHNRPDEGIRGRPIRISHRSDRVESLPPDALRLRGMKTWWLGIRYVNRPAPLPDAVRDARQAVRQARYPARTTTASAIPLSPAEREALAAAMQRQLMAAMRSDFFLRNSLPTYWEAVIPLWPVHLLFAMLPALWLLARARRALRRYRGHCAACDYDQTGNTSGICPECGTPSLGSVSGPEIGPAFQRPAGPLGQ